MQRRPSTADIVKQTKEPVNSKIIYFKLPSQWRKKKRKMRKSEERLTWIMGYHQENNLDITRDREGKEREKAYFKKYWQKISNLGRDMDIQVQEANRSLNRFSPNRSSPRHIRIKKKKKKSENFKSSLRKETHQSHTGNSRKAIGRVLSRSLAG